MCMCVCLKLWPAQNFTSHFSFFFLSCFTSLFPLLFGSEILPPNKVPKNVSLKSSSSHETQRVPAASGNAGTRTWKARRNQEWYFSSLVLLLSVIHLLYPTWPSILPVHFSDQGTIQLNNNYRVSIPSFQERVAPIRPVWKVLLSWYWNLWPAGWSHVLHT